jgi:uncharacterized protein (DUF433 family)
VTTAVRDIELGEGLFAASEIERFVALQFGPGATSQSLRWLREVVAPPRHSRGRPDYSFADLISVFAIVELRDRGVSLQRIREAKERLSRLVEVDQPLALQGIYTDGAFVFADLGVTGQLTNLNLCGQEGHRSVLELNLARVLFRTGERIEERPARAWSPADGICVDPAVQFGAPCVEGRRIPTRILHDLAAEGATADDLAFEFGLRVADVQQALDFEHHVAALPR